MSGVYAYSIPAADIYDVGIYLKGAYIIGTMVL